jgi:hypothetical protein
MFLESGWLVIDGGPLVRVTSGNLSPVLADPGIDQSH